MDHEKAHGNRQRQQVNQLKRRYRNAWTQADALRREQRHTWPDWCYVPIRHWRDMAQAVGPNHEPPVDAIIDAGRLAALGAWRVTQGIYRFDPNLYAALINTPLTGDLPHELLYRLPRWCVYIETPGLSVASQPIIGYYAHLNQQENGRTDLRLLIDSDAENGLFPISIPPITGQRAHRHHSEQRPLLGRRNSHQPSSPYSRRHRTLQQPRPASRSLAHLLDGSTGERAHRPRPMAPAHHPQHRRPGFTPQN